MQYQLSSLHDCILGPKSVHPLQAVLGALGWASPQVPHFSALEASSAPFSELAFLIGYTSEITQNLSFWVCLISLSITSCRLRHVAMGTCLPFMDE